MPTRAEEEPRPRSIINRAEARRLLHYMVGSPSTWTTTSGHFDALLKRYGASPYQRISRDRIEYDEDVIIAVGRKYHAAQQKARGSAAPV